MRIRLRKFEWLPKTLGDLDDDYKDDIIRPFYFTINLIILFTEGMHCDNLFTYLFCPIGVFVLMIYFGPVDLILLPFKLLYAVEVKK